MSPSKKNSGNFSQLVQLSLLVGIIAFLVYANTLKNNYALDDVDLICNNTIVKKGALAIPELLSTPYRHGISITSNDLYRPLSLITFAIEYQLFGANPTIGHFVNSLLFAVCVVMLFLFIYHLFERKKVAVAIITAVLFALHPIHTEVVANIKSRDEILCSLFALLSLNICISYIEQGKIKQLIAATICVFLALLSKETAITIIVIIPLIGFFYRNEHMKRSIYITLSAVVMGVLFLLIRYYVLSTYHANSIADIDFIDNMLVHAPSFAARLATEITIMGGYIRLLIIPYPLICDYSFNSIPFTTFSNPIVILSACIYVFLGAYSIVGIFKKTKDPFAFSILFILITISLFSNIPFLMGTPMAERFLFLPSVGFCLALALAFEKWILRSDNADIPSLKTTRSLVVLAPIAVVYILLTVYRNADWADNATLFRADVSKSPNNAKLAYYYGTELNSNIAANETDPVAREQFFKEGISYLHRAVSIFPGFELAYTELGNTYFQLHQLDSAEVYNSKALLLNPKNSLTLYNQAGVYFATKRYSLALETCRKAIVNNPQWVEPYSSIGLCFLQLGQIDSSLYYLYKGISINPDYKSSYTTLAMAYQSIDKADSARKYEAIAATK